MKYATKLKHGRISKNKLDISKFLATSRSLHQSKRLCRSLATLMTVSLSLLWSAPSSSAPCPDPNHSGYNLVWQDEFTGRGKPESRADNRWFYFFGYGPNNQLRDAYYTRDDAYLDGDNLHLRLRFDSTTNRLYTSYLRTFDPSVAQNRWTLFGPGNGKYIEARVSFARLQALGPWVGFWLMSPTRTYDCIPQNGTEIDIMEYVMGGGGWQDQYGAFNHWGDRSCRGGGIAGQVVKVPRGYLTDGGWHTFGLEWSKSRLTYYLDGKPVFPAITEGVASNTTQALILSVEYDEGQGNAWGISPEIKVSDYKNVLSDGLLVDYVRVCERP